MLRRNGLMGLILVLIVLGLFLEPKLAVWVTMGIPISFLGSMLLLPRWDVSINMISLFAFIVTLGIVVDDAIVVGESVYHERQAGRSFLEAAVIGVRKVAVPVVFSVLTTCVAFAPLLFIPGIAGKFFMNIPTVVISVLMVSLVESLFVLPAHLSHTMPRWLQFVLAPVLLPLALLAMLRLESRLEVFIERIYRPMLEWSIRWRVVTIAASIAFFLSALGLAAGGRLPFTFMPKVEGDQVTVSLRMPVGTPFAETRAITERMLRAGDEVLAENGGEAIRRGVLSIVGGSIGTGGPRSSGSSSEGGHIAGIQLYLVQSDLREIGTGRFAELWRERVGEIPGAEALTFNFAIGASAGDPIDVRLSHRDNDTLEAAAERLADDLGAYSGLRDIDSGVSPGKEQLSLTLTPEGRARGLTESDLGRQVRAAFYGAEAVRQQRGREEVRTYVRLPRAERISMADVENFIVRTPDGGEMPLGQAGHVERGRAYTVITRVDGRRVISVTADIVDGVGNATEVNQSLVARELPQLLADVHGLTYEMGGEQREQGETFGAMAKGMLAAQLMIFGLLAIIFRSYVQPLIVMSAIPFGIVGAFLGHAIMGYGLSMISMMGIIALGGVVVNDSLVMIDAVNGYRGEGLSPHDAVVRGATRRFRPILLTSLTTFFGLVPMIFEPSVQARFLIPMAISLGFGVMFSTGILLFLVPSSYLALEDIAGFLRKVTRLVGLAPADDAHEPPEPPDSPDDGLAAGSASGPNDRPRDGGPSGGAGAEAALPPGAADPMMARSRMD